MRACKFGALDEVSKKPDVQMRAQTTVQGSPPHPDSGRLPGVKNLSHRQNIQNRGSRREAPHLPGKLACYHTPLQL
jgi:hypothetical protein